MRVTKLVLSYDGTDFCGWQRQPDKRTVQGVIEKALAKLCGKRIAVAGAGRTDAGVHAQGQVASFEAALRLQGDALRRALNALLPGDVRILSAGSAPPGFHARRSARSKVYRYRILNSPRISPFLLRYVLHWPGPLDLERMADGAERFKREADFSAFSSNRLLYPVRRVRRSEIQKRGSQIIFTIEADGFLRYMVRTIVGTLIEAGRGKVEPRAIEDLFAGRKRTLKSPTAPARGLCLVKVVY
ncbi:MAG: tRNA pseudouridine(38-40) synthase TruA [Candidatus Aminicenantes bacterium]|nr:tRNA pseudouridine(38-40) synthase TruA [Candidatus Aminicenantes bacterium]